MDGLRAEWFIRYDNKDWNGEYYQIDKDHVLRPIYDWDDVDEDGVPSLSGYEIR